MFKEKAEKIFAKNYKILMAIPIIITIIAVIFIGVKYQQTGDLFNKDVSLRGGIAATVYTDNLFTEEQIKSSLQVDATVRTISEVTSGKQLGFIVEVSDLNRDQLKERLQNLGLELTSQNYSVEETGERLGQAFYRQLLFAIGLAFLLMGITIFITFRTIAPSLAVIFAAFMNLTVTVAVINLLGMNVSTAGIAGLLLIIGYSIDTDVLLTTWVLKKKEYGSLFQRMFHSMQTGLTMTLCAIGVMLVGLLVSNSIVIKEMFTIIFIALIVDIFATYLTNTGILWHYCKRKNIT